MTSLLVESIPADLKELPRWVGWKWVERDGKRTKPPFDPATGRPGDATDPGLWMEFERAVSLLGEFDGLGFAVADSPFTGVDLDNCLDEAGSVAPWAEAIVRRLDSYTERTPSGRGLRVWVRGKLPPGRRRKGPIEMYDAGRYFTVTGRRLDGTPAAIADRAAELAGLHAEIFAAPGREGAVSPPPPPPSLLSDEEVLRKAMAARNGAAFSALFSGDTAAFGHDESAADLGLCSRLAFWFGGDLDAIDRVFRRSGLYRAKWERVDYRERTIARALEGTAFYDPGAHARNGHAGNNGFHDGGGGGNGVPGGAGDDHPAPPPVSEGVTDPHRLARLFLSQAVAVAEGPSFLFWNEEFWRFGGAAWFACPDREIAAELTRVVKADFDRMARLFGKEAVAVTTKVVGNATQALRSLALLTLRDCPEQPAWIGPREAGEDLPDPAEVLPAANCLVHLPALISGDRCTLPLSPRFFSAYSLGYDFVAEPGEPAEWLAFLRSLWPDDADSIACLQEWLGYLLVPDTGLQKILMLIGPKRSGKGTIGRLIRALVGPRNVAAPTLSGLATNFGLSPLIGKTVAVISDARLSGRADSQVIVERLLSISGEDAQTIDRKHREAWNGRLPVRFVLVSNELPRLGDSSGALPSRMVLLRMTRSFLGSEDTELTARILAERPAILRWAIDGWARLRGRGRFLQPESGRELLGDLEELSSPIGGFVEERCDVGPGCSILVKDLFAAWKSYCVEKGRDHPGDEQGFGRNLRAVLPCLKTARPTVEGKRVREYVGIDLKSPF